MEVVEVEEVEEEALVITEEWIKVHPHMSFLMALSCINLKTTLLSNVQI